ncbi:hypothetical protein BBJ28_00027254 [Nothophytophthora sp. Chile5]|nr:hypothetical protein BBJ28_00027254 [Nothophytophthora sp. Chile5]
MPRKRRSYEQPLQSPHQVERSDHRDRPSSESVPAESYQATYQMIVLSRRSYQAQPESDQTTPRGDIENSDVQKELSDLKERVRILSAETDTAQGDQRDNEGNLESLRKTVFNLRGATGVAETVSCGAEGAESPSP